MSHSATTAPHKKGDNRSVIALLILVVTAMILLAWYAFFSVPPLSPIEKHPLKTREPAKSPVTGATEPSLKPTQTKPPRTSND